MYYLILYTQTLKVDVITPILQMQKIRHAVFATNEKSLSYLESQNLNQQV